MRLVDKIEMGPLSQIGGILINIIRSRRPGVHLPNHLPLPINRAIADQLVKKILKNFESKL